MMARRSSNGPLGAELDLTESRVGGIRVVTARGEVDLSTSERFGKLLQRVAAEPGGPIVIDLTACAFIDSSGLAAILQAAVRRDGFSIAAGTGPPSEVLEMTAIDKTIPVHESLDAALSAAGRDR